MEPRSPAWSTAAGLAPVPSLDLVGAFRHKSPVLEGLRAAVSSSLLPLTVHRDKHPNQLGVILRVV